VRQQDCYEAELDLAHGRLENKIAPDLEMDADLAGFIQRCELNVRRVDRERSFDHGKCKVSGVDILRHSPVDDARGGIVHNSGIASAPIDRSQ